MIREGLLEEGMCEKNEGSRHQIEELGAGEAVQASAKAFKAQVSLAW